MNTTNGIPMVIGYKVGIDPKMVKGNQQGELIESFLPLVLENRAPFTARLMAISFVQVHPYVSMGDGLHRLAVFLIDYESGREYLIYINKKPTVRMLENLETEFMLYLRNGYPYYGWHLLTDAKGKAYRVITTEDWIMTDNQPKNFNN